MKTNCIFTSSPIGLGHVTRDMAIFNEIMQICDQNNYNINFEFISGYLGYNYILNEINLLYPGKFVISDLYKPPHFSINNGILRNGLIWLLKYVLYYNRSKRILNDYTSSNLKQKSLVDLIISDEDLAAVSVAKKLKKTAIFITDILNTRFSRNHFGKKIEGLLNNNMKKIIDSCDCVIIPDYGDDIDNYYYVGPVVRHITKKRESLRSQFSFHKKTILVTIGGTTAGSYLIKKTIAAYCGLKKSIDCDLVVSHPPNLKIDNLNNKLFKEIGYVSNLHEYIFASDLVISLAGKSTIDESVAYGTPGIFIPIKNHFEQEERAKSLGYVYNDLYKLDLLIKEKLFLQHKGIQNKYSEGAQRAALLIAKYLNN